MTSLEDSEPIFSTANCDVKVSNKNKVLQRDKEDKRVLDYIH